MNDDPILSAGPVGSQPQPVHLVPPGETPEGESSTCLGICTRNSPPPRRWEPWLPLLVIAVLTLSCAGFMAARIAAM